MFTAVEKWILTTEIMIIIHCLDLYTHTHTHAYAIRKASNKKKCTQITTQKSSNCCECRNRMRRLHKMRTSVYIFHVACLFVSASHVCLLLLRTLTAWCMQYAWAIDMEATWKACENAWTTTLRAVCAHTTAQRWNQNNNTLLIQTISISIFDSPANALCPTKWASRVGKALRRMDKQFALVRVPERLKRGQMRHNIEPHRECAICCVYGFQGSSQNVNKHYRE